MAATTVELVVYLPSLLERAAGGQREIAVAASTVRGAIDTLLGQHPLLAVHLFDEQGGLREHVNLFYNDTNLRWLEDWEIPLRSGDTITVLQAVSGGSV
jgi:molybdopterin converting factor small subunit